MARISRLPPASLILDWARWCAVGPQVTGYLEDKLQVRDQLLLTWLLRRQKTSIAPMDHRFNWMYFESSLPDALLVVHWAGVEGKQTLRQRAERHERF